MSTGRLNQQLGKGFESIFETMARYSGFLPIRTGHSCRIIGKGRLKLIRGQLDFQLITQDGRVGFYDTKTFKKPFFTYSEICPHQLERSLLYCERKVPSGFVVWFTKSDVVSFFSGNFIFHEGPGRRFLPVEGVALGKIGSLNLKPLFQLVDLVA